MDNKNMVVSYLTLRRAIGILGIILPLLCFIFAGFEVLPSLSAYYHSPGVAVFVGVLCIAGAFQLAYKGYDKKDNTLASVAGISLITTALAPSGGSVGWLHNLSAVVFFLSTAYISAFIFTKGYSSISTNKAKRNIIYRACAIILIMALASIKIIDFKYITFISESIMLIAFGTSWLIKGETLLKDK